MDNIERITAFSALSMLLAFHLFAALRNGKRAIELPFLICATYLALIYPTLYYQLLNKSYIPDRAYILYCTFSAACIFSATLAYSLSFRRLTKRLKSKKNDIDDDGIKRQRFSKTVLIVIFLIGFFCSIQIDPTLHGGILGGEFAILLFFARLLRPVMIISWCSYLLNKSKLYLYITIACLLSFIPFIVISGRRSDTFFVLLALAAPLILIKNYTPSVRQILGGVALSFFIFVAFPTLRVYTKKGEFASALETNLEEATTKKINGTDSNEVIEAARKMYFASVSSEYSGIAPFVNKITSQYVSSTIFGQRLKDALSMDYPSNDFIEVQAARRTDLIGQIGNQQKWWLSPTGIGDAFYSAGWFGCLYYALFGMLAKRMMTLARESSGLWNKTSYSLFCISIPYSMYDSISALIPLIIIPYFTVYFCAKGLSRALP